MVNRLDDLGGYKRIAERQNKVYSYVGDPMLELSRETDSLLQTIEFNLSQMKGQRQAYQRDTTTRAENQTFQLYQRAQQQNRKDIAKVKENIKRLDALAENCSEDSEEHTVRRKQSTKFLYRLRGCLQTQIDSDNQLNRTVEAKKQKVLGMVPPGLRLEDVMNGNYSAETRNAASDLLQKLDELEKLARSVNECVQMMRDIQLLVELQGRKINIVGDNVREANQFLGRADKHLKAKVQEQSKGMRKKCLLLLAAIVIAGIAVFVLYKTGVF